MARYWTLAAMLLALFLLLFLATERLGVPLLADPAPWLRQADAATALLGVGLLVADVALPVPSGPVMIALGARFGAAGGALLSILGTTGATLTAFALGRRGSRLLAWATEDETRARADALLRRWGAVAIVATRPVPLLAEAVAILAGASSLGWGRAALAAVAGSLPTALFYTLTGTLATNYLSAGAIAGVAFLSATLFWIMARRARHP